MSGRDLMLEPFPGPNAPAGLEIRCAVNRFAEVLSVTWGLTGNRASVAVPPPAEVPTRRDGLWKDTCFELFLARRDSQNYWEFNISPSGDWNAYRFDSYRDGMREEEAFSSLPVRVDREGGLYSISLEIDLEKILPASAQLEAAISAVISGPGSELSYWALVHPGQKPDFHRRDAFLVRM